MEERNQAYITLYTVIGDFDRVKKALVNQFSNMTKEVRDLDAAEPNVENFAICFHDDTEVELHINTNQEIVGRHITGMYNYFAQMECEKQELHYSVLQQIRVFNCVIGSSFMLDDNDRRTNYIVNTMFLAAKDITALVLMPDMRLLNYEGKLVFSAEGKSDFDEYIPIGNADFLDSGAEETSSDISRRERSIAILEEKGIPYIPKLRAAVMESESVFRSPDDIAGRLFAMFAVCVYSEALNSGEAWEEAQKYPERVTEILSGRLDGLLTPKEKVFLKTKEPERNDIIQFGWRYECCHVLMWALGILDKLGYPDQMCDVPGMAKNLWQQESLEKFLKSAKPRLRSDILDAADLILRYDWACVDARIKKQEIPAGLDAGVVQEWHYAFNWLIGANGNADWDHISTDT